MIDSAKDEEFFTAYSLERVVEKILYNSDYY